MVKTGFVSSLNESPVPPKLIQGSGQVNAGGSSKSTLAPRGGNKRRERLLFHRGKDHGLLRIDEGFLPLSFEFSIESSREWVGRGYFRTMKGNSFIDPLVFSNIGLCQWRRLPK
jgi:hypothetical protein